MADSFAFIDAYDNVLLDLNTPEAYTDADPRYPGWRLHRGLDMGTPQIERVYLSQAPYNGSTLATSRLPVTTMRVPLFLWPQDATSNPNGDSVAEKLKYLMESLFAQLDKATNILKYVPDGFEDASMGAFYFDTYRSTMPSLMRGMDVPSPFLLGHTGVPILLDIDREPDFRYSSGASPLYATSAVGGWHF